MLVKFEINGKIINMASTLPSPGWLTRVFRITFGCWMTNIWGNFSDAPKFEAGHTRVWGFVVGGELCKKGRQNSINGVEKESVQCTTRKLFYNLSIFFLNSHGKLLRSAKFVQNTINYSGNFNDNSSGKIHWNDLLTNLCALHWVVLCGIAVMV